MTQLIIVIIALILAVAYTLRRTFLLFRHTGKECHSCNGCDKCGKE